MGADEAILISDPALENSDSLVTARVLVAAINKMEDYDLHGGAVWVAPQALP
jgi:electron transfer flavoprotein alpha/beta subunit